MYFNKKNVKEKAKSKRGRKPKKSSEDKSVLADAMQYDVQLAGSCNKKMNQIRGLLNTNTTFMSASNESHKWEEAIFPIFQFKCKWLRAMIALTL
jgi:conjugal transfer/entry exclusion protein